MIYFWGLLKAEFVKSIKLTFRYKFNTLFNILFWAVLMVLLSHVLLRGKPEVKTWAFICSFMIWLIANNSFISVVDSIVSETVQGTIEQLYLNSRSFFTLLLVKGLVSSVITIIQSVLTLFICVLLVPSVQAVFFIQWLCTSAVSHIHLLPYRSGNHVRLTGIKIQEHIVILQHGILHRLWYPDLRGSLYLFQDSTHVAVPLCRGECGHTAVVAPWIIFDTEYPDGHSLQ